MLFSNCTLYSLISSSIVLSLFIILTMLNALFFAGLSSASDPCLLYLTDRRIVADCRCQTPTPCNPMALAEQSTESALDSNLVETAVGHTRNRFHGAHRRQTSSYFCTSCSIRRQVTDCKPIIGTRRLTKTDA